MSDSRKRRRIQPQLVSAPAHQEERKLPAKRAALPPPTLPPAVAPKQQRWTELTAVGQILADEIILYQQANQSNLSQGELRQLRSWSECVQNRIYQQTTLVLENAKLATEMRQKQKEMELTRDDLMVLRTQTKMFRDEAEQLGEGVEETEKEASALQGASQFLTALQSLAKHASRENE